MAVEDLKSSQGTVKTGLQENAVGLPGMLMQGIATIAPSFAILASFVFIVSFAAVVTPWASAAGVVVVWKSYFAPFTSSGVVFWGLLVFFAVVVVTILALIYMRVTGREEWMAKAQLVFEQTGSSH